MAQTKTTRETSIEKCITHKAWKKYEAYLEGPHKEVKAGAGREGGRA